MRDDSAVEPDEVLDPAGRPDLEVESGYGGELDLLDDEDEVEVEDEEEEDEDEDDDEDELEEDDDYDELLFADEEDD